MEASKNRLRRRLTSKVMCVCVFATNIYFCFSQKAKKKGKGISEVIGAK